MLRGANFEANADVSCTRILDDKPTYRDTLTGADSRLGLRHATSHSRCVSTRRHLIVAQTGDMYTTPGSST
jgi:hypothetical protein